MRFGADWHVTHLGEHCRMTLSNGVLVHFLYEGPRGEVDLVVTPTKPQLLAMLASGSADGVTPDGDLDVLRRLMAVLETPNPAFAIVTP